MRRLRRSPTLLLGVSLIAVFAAMAVAPRLFVVVSPATHDPRDCSLRDPTGEYQDRLPPSVEHWFGTDLQGCDYFTTVVHGARASMLVGLVTVCAAGLIALLLGGLAGYAGGWVDGSISRVTDVFFGIPALVGAILLLSLLTDETRGIIEVALVLGLLGWPLASRLFRSSVIQVRNAPYVDASRMSGASRVRTVVRHVLPNASTPMLAYATIAVASAIVAEAGLSFLGIGLQPPTISWGQMIQSAQPHLADSPHLLLFPSVFLSLVVLGFLLLGDALRRALHIRGPE